MRGLCGSVCVIVLGLASASLAGPNAGYKVAVHVAPHGVSCKSMPVFSDCSQITITYAGSGDIDALPVFYGLSEYLLVEFGLTWPSEWGSCEYTRCAGDISLGSITWPGDGMVTTWFDCQYGWAVTPGIGWLYAIGPGLVSMIPDEPTMDLLAIDCVPIDSTTVKEYPAAIFSAGVAGQAGDDPCAAPLLPLTLTLADNAGTGCAQRGAVLTYTVSYGNTANGEEVQNVIVGANADEQNLDFTSASDGGEYSPGNGMVRWDMSTLAPGESGHVTASFIVRQSAPAWLECVGTISGSRTTITNAAKWTAICAGSYVALDLAKSDGVGTCAEPGDTLNYAIAYGNSRNATEIHEVVLADSLPARAAYVSATSGGIYESGSHAVTWPIGTLASGQSGNVQVSVRVLASPGEYLENKCLISAQEPVAREVSETTQVCGTLARNLNHKIAIHVKPHDTSCGTLPAFPECRDLVTTYAGCGDLDFIPVFFDLEQYVVVETGLTWPEDWGTCTFTACGGDALLGDIRSTGDGIAICWNQCQQTWSVALGYGWLCATSPGLITPVEGPDPIRMGTGDCADIPDSMSYTPPAAVYASGACGAEGGDPCTTVRVEPTTWGSIKAMFK